MTAAIREGDLRPGDQVQLMSWAASAILHLPDGPAAQRRDADLPSLPERLAWIHAYDAFALA